MPSVSRQQQKLMHGIASGNIKPGKGKPDKATAQDFVRADHARGSTTLPKKIAHAVLRSK
jgi:hypothetical protein